MNENADIPAVSIHLIQITGAQLTGGLKIEMRGKDGLSSEKTAHHLIEVFFSRAAD